MTVDVVFCGTDDCDVTSSTTTFEDARSGTGTATVSVGTVTSTTATPKSTRVVSTYQFQVSFMGFDTSVVASDIVTSVVLSLFVTGKAWTSGDDTQVFAKDYGAAVDASDWVAGNTYQSLPILANMTASPTTSAYNDWTTQGSFASAINGSGFTKLVAAQSVGLIDDNAIATNHFISFSSADAAGTTQDPKLTVTHVAPPSGGTMPMMGV